jgi:hypothetical protein
MKKILLVAVPVSLLVAVAAFLLSDRAQLTPESAIGYVSVLGLLFVAALDYRISWKRLVTRN